MYAGGDSAIDDDQFLSYLTVVDLINDVPLSVELISTDPFFKQFKILFQMPIPPNGKFKTYYSWTWPGAMIRRRNYVFVDITPFKRGVEKLVITLKFFKKPKLCRAFYVKAKDIRKVGLENFQPLEITANILNEGKTLRWELDAPKPGIYMFRFSV